MGGMVLLADDSITIQKVVELTFAETEHKVVAVGSGRELFQRLPEVKPDVVVCDVVMPDMNGYEVCQTLKSDPATLHIPVVLLTGTFEPFDRDRAMAAGCDAIITKPFEARELINAVEDLIKRAQALAATPADSGIVDHGIPEGVPALDFTGPGFEKLAPLAMPPATIPEDGIDLTASALGKSNPPTPRPAPPELQEPAPPRSPRLRIRCGATTGVRRALRGEGDAPRGVRSAAARAGWERDERRRAAGTAGHSARGRDTCAASRRVRRSPRRSPPFRTLRRKPWTKVRPSGSSFSP